MLTHLIYIYKSLIKLLRKNKLVICAFLHLHEQISREKFEPEPGLELRPLGL